MNELTSDLNQIHSSELTCINDFVIDKKCAQKLTVINVNLRGIKTNYPMLTSFLRDLNFCPTLIVVTESHLKVG